MSAATVAKVAQAMENLIVPGTVVFAYLALKKQKREKAEAEKK